MPDASFTRMATKAASIKRSTMTSGVGATPALVSGLSNLSCTPLDPVSVETQTRLKLDSAYELRQTSFQSGYDIRKGDLLVMNSVEYPVRAVEDYDWRDTTYLRVVVEKIAPLN